MKFATQLVGNIQNLWTKFQGLIYKGALNPNFLNFTKNREKFCL